MNRHKSSRRRPNRKPNQQAQTRNRKQKLPKNTAPVELTIDHIGGRGDGVGIAQFTHNYETKDWHFFVPQCLPGERVRVQPHSLASGGIHADLIELIEASPERIDPLCPIAHSCGGCQFQHMEDSAYARLKESMVSSPLMRAGIDIGTLRPLARSQKNSRRRVRFGLRRTAAELIIGLHERHSDKLIEPQGCITIDTKILDVRTALKSSLAPILTAGMTGEIHLTALDAGIDVLLDLHITPNGEQLTAISQCAAECEGIIRLSIQSDGQASMPLYAPDTPILSWPNADVTPPPGGFLQASKSGEATLQAGVAEIAADAKYIIDLFCGSGTLSLPLLAKDCQIHAADNAGPALEAFSAAADKAGRGGQLTVYARNLYEAPMTSDQLKDADLIILDPPRSGAKDQIEAIAHSGCPRIAYISCNPHSFAKDAAELIKAGYIINWCQPVDQFYYSSHVELLSEFIRVPETL